MTPYHFANNNPIVFSDPTGLRPEPFREYLGKDFGFAGGTGFSWNPYANKGHWSDAFGGIYGSGAEESWLTGDSPLDLFGSSNSSSNGGISLAAQQSMVANSADNATTSWSYQNGALVSASGWVDTTDGQYMDNGTMLAPVTVYGNSNGQITNASAALSSVANQINGINGGSCNKCVNPSTIGQQPLGFTYPGPYNPKNINGDDDFSHVPSYQSEYPGIGHDRRYDNLGIKGGLGLLTDTRAIGADWRFVAEEIAIAQSPGNVKFLDRVSAASFATILGAVALPKTIWHFGTNQNAVSDTMFWFAVSNQGVTNSPTPHSHN